MEGENRVAARLSHAANSRLVDKRYYTPSPAADWRAGRIQEENTEREGAYIEAILAICAKENIDTVFPSFDPHVYVFSKNKARFESCGILLPVPDYHIVITPLDKYRTIKAAEKFGFPCPKTYLPESEEELRKIADELGFPLVIKPRFTAAGRGTAIVRDFSELLEKIHPTIEHHGMPLIQEYIPGDLGEYIHVLMARTGELRMAIHKRFQRYFRKQAFPVYRESIPPQPYARLAGKLLTGIGWWGGAVVETRIDSRDSIPKLMEINPRFGSGLLELTEIGINAPHMCLKIARREEVRTVENYPVAVCLHPVDDALVFGLRCLNLLCARIVTVTRASVCSDRLDSPTSFHQLIQPYKYAYFSGKKKMLDPRIKLFVRDPVVLMIVWLQRFASVLGALGDLGRSLLQEFIPGRPQRRISEPQTNTHLSGGVAPADQHGSKPEFIP
jgi:predicted ATP-grasp superfamily ATP-dependent carboligase